MSNTEVILVIVGKTKPQATPKTGNGTDLRSRCLQCRVLRGYSPTAMLMACRFISTKRGLTQAAIAARRSSTSMGTHPVCKAFANSRLLSTLRLPAAFVSAASSTGTRFACVLARARSMFAITSLARYGFFDSAAVTG